MKGKRRSLTVAGLCEAMESIAPTKAAAEWDNVGLLIGDRNWRCRSVLLAIDLMPAVLNEAVQRKCDAIVAYHPPIFRSVKRMVVDATTQDGIAAEALARRIAVYSPHTALDAAPGGTNETLAILAGLQDLLAFEPTANPPTAKLVVFVPAPQTDRVSEALFAAGAGRIGAYEKCSFRTRGEGTFLGDASTNPAIGQRGRFERVEETRLEVILPQPRQADVLSALREAHPYEEPAFDVYPIESGATREIGQGRIGQFPKPVRLGELAAGLARKISAPCTQIVGAMSTRVETGMVCVGAAGSLPFHAVHHRCGPGTVVITGEFTHHDALQVKRAGAVAIALSHWASERPVLKPLATRLKHEMTGIRVHASRKDCDPFSIVAKGRKT